MDKALVAGISMRLEAVLVVIGQAQQL